MGSRAGEGSPAHLYIHQPRLQSVGTWGSVLGPAPLFTTRTPRPQLFLLLGTCFLIGSQHQQRQNQKETATNAPYFSKGGLPFLLPRGPLLHIEDHMFGGLLQSGQGVGSRGGMNLCFGQKEHWISTVARGLCGGAYSEDACVASPLSSRS